MSEKTLLDVILTELEESTSKQRIEEEPDSHYHNESLHFASMLLSLIKEVGSPNDRALLIEKLRPFRKKMLDLGQSYWRPAFKSLEVSWELDCEGRQAYERYQNCVDIVTALDDSFPELSASEQAHQIGSSKKSPAQFTSQIKSKIDEILSLREALRLIQKECKHTNVEDIDEGRSVRCLDCLVEDEVPWYS